MAARIPPAPSDRPRRGRQAPWTDFAHTGPGTLAGRFMRRFWHPVFRAEDLKPGKAMPLKVMSEDFTLYRGASGTPYTVAFRCAHRGTQLSTGWVEGENLRCRYHGWMYDGSGQCVEQPAERNPFCDRVRIHSYPTEEYLGLIFVYLGEGTPPPPPRFPDFEGEGWVEAHLSFRACNYFSNIENACDEAHVSFTHRTRDPARQELMEIPEISFEATDYGIARYGKRPNGEVRVTHLCMPNIHHITGFDNADQSIHWRVPIDDESHAIPSITLRHGERRPHADHDDPWTATAHVADLGEAVLAGRLSLDDIPEDRYLINIQDYVTQAGQGRIADREHERLGVSDAVIVLLRTLWSRELRALAAGKPLTEWKRPERLMAAVGV
jgi:5,5'-dehydrodivanillate O-demethylase